MYYLKKKILIIGGSDSVYIKEYVEHILEADSSLNFTILTYSKERYLDFYKKHHIKLVLMPEYCQEHFKLKTYYKFLLTMLRGKFDYIHVQAVFYNAVKLATIISGKKGKVILSYWAYPTDRAEIKKIYPLLKYVYKISFVTKSLKKEFQNIYGHRYDSKISCMDLYLGGMETMKRMQKNKNLKELRYLAKRKMGFNYDKIVVAVGYCGRKDQQHLKVLYQLGKMSDEILKMIHIFIHVSYGITDESYIRQIEIYTRTLIRRGCICEVSREYLEGNKLGYLRFGIDIFINSVVQDVLSSSLLEYLCGGTVVLNGKWLNYKELEDYGIECVQYKSFEELPIKLEDCIKNIGTKLQEENAKLVWKYLSWNSNKWLQLYTVSKVKK